MDNEELAIENEFNIEVPDEMLVQDSITTIENFSNVLENYIVKGK